MGGHACLAHEVQQWVGMSNFDKNSLCRITMASYQLSAALCRKTKHLFVACYTNATVRCAICISICGGIDNYRFPNKTYGNDYFHLCLLMPGGVR